MDKITSKYKCCYPEDFNLKLKEFTENSSRMGRHYNLAKGERFSEQTHFSQTGLVLTSRFFLNVIDFSELTISSKDASFMLPILA
jgi:hypothetical protein